MYNIHALYSINIFRIGLKLNSCKATDLHSLAPTLIKHTWSS